MWGVLKQRLEQGNLLEEIAKHPHFLSYTLKILFTQSPTILENFCSISS